MKPERWDRVKNLLAEALDRPPATRESLLAERCGDDIDLRREVESLLASHDLAGSFLDDVGPLAAALDAPLPLEGRSLGSYRLLERIGEGGMGSVYRAARADDSYEQEVAIKVVHGGLLSDFVLERFRSERQILARLEHPNIARLLDGGATDEGLPYLVMEYVAGRPITQDAAARRLSTKQRVELFRTVCSAVAYAHQNLVVHRDLKPTNILVTADGTPKLLDFGIAKLLDPSGAEATPTLTGLRMMTPGYASPEQLQGAGITTTSDVYSLGVLLYELLTGQRPYVRSGRSPEELARLIAAGEPRRPSQAASTPDAVTEVAAVTHKPPGGTPEGLRRTLEGDLDNIVLKALRSEPERRYSSVDQLSEDLRRYLNGLPVLARPDTFSYRAAKFVERHKAGVASALLFTVSLVGGSAAIAWQARQAEIHRARAERRFAEVRQLATSFLFEFHDSVESLAGATQARQLVVETALAHLDGLAQEAGEDPTLQRELATAYERLSRIQGEHFSANLGEAEASLTSQRRAVAIYETLAQIEDSPRARRELAAAYEALGERLHGEGEADAALAAHRKSLALLEALSAADPTDAELRHEIAELHGRIGQALSIKGQAQASLAQHRQGASILEALAREGNADLAVRWELADAYLKIGMRLGSPMSANVGDPEGGLASMEKSLAAFEDLLSSNPLDARLRRTVAAVHSNISDVLGAMERHPEALASLERATAHFEELSAADPSNAQAVIDLSLGLLKAASLRHQVDGEAGLALQDSRAAVELLEPLVSSHPDNTHARAVLAHACANHGDLLAEGGDFAAAVRSYEKGIAVQEELVRANPTSVSGRFNLAAAHAGVAAVHLRRGQRAEVSGVQHWRAARDAYSKALGLFDELRDEGALSGSDTSGVEEIAREAAEVERLLDTMERPARDRRISG